MVYISNVLLLPTSWNYIPMYLVIVFSDVIHVHVYPSQAWSHHIVSKLPSWEVYTYIDWHKKRFISDIYYVITFTPEDQNRQK